MTLALTSISSADNRRLLSNQGIVSSNSPGTATMNRASSTAKLFPDAIADHFAPVVSSMESVPPSFSRAMDAQPKTMINKGPTSASKTAGE